MESNVSTTFSFLASIFTDVRQVKPPSGPENHTPGTSFSDVVTISGNTGTDQVNPDGKQSARSADHGSQTVSMQGSIQEAAQLRTLKKRDAEVRSHEMAHKAFAGKHAKGGASFTYQRGPDGNSYAIGGEVSIDISAESSPEATVDKMRIIQRAALAPLNPSAADRRIAAQAASKELEAQQQLMRDQQAELSMEKAVPHGNISHTQENISSSHRSAATAKPNSAISVTV